MSFIFGGNTGLTYEDLQRRRKALQARKGGPYRTRTAGDGLSALGHALGTRLEAKRLQKAETARQGRADNVFSAFQTIMGGGSGSPAFQPASFAPLMDAGAQSAGWGGDDIPPAEGTGSDLRSGIAATAQSLGIDPVDLATAISYETAGTFDPTKRGPTTQWGQHRGLIQFGEPQAKQYGVNWDDPVGSQLGPDGAVAKYLRDTGVRPGMGLLDIYSAINAGGVGLYDRSDANNGGAPGTVRDKVEKQMAAHRAKALAMFGDNQVASADPDAAFRDVLGGQDAQTQQPTGQEPTLLAQATQQPRQRNNPFGGVDPRVIDMLGDPSLSPHRRSAMRFLLEQHLKANAPVDPLKQLQLEKGQLELERLRNPERNILQGADGYKYYQDTGERVLPGVDRPPEPGYQMLSSEQAQQMGLPEGNYQQGPNGRISLVGGGGTNVTVNNGAGETAFAKTTGNELAKSTNELAAAGDNARQNLVRVDRLESLLNESPSGLPGIAKSFASSMGLGEYVNASDIEAAQALISAMVPEQRPVGSGTMSDADLALFKQSLPRIINTKDGNQKIIDTIRGIAQYDIQRGEIARRLQLGEIVPRQAFEMYGSLENPLDWLNEKDKGGPVSYEEYFRD